MNQKWKTAIAYGAARMGEASTWRGVILIGTACGAKINEQQSLAIIAGGLALAGFVGAIFPDPDKSSTAAPLSPSTPEQPK